MNTSHAHGSFEERIFKVDCSSTMGCRRAPKRHHNYIGHQGAVTLIRAKEKLDRGIGWKHRHLFDPGIERKSEALRFSMIALSLVSIITEDFIETRGRKQGH
jgi:hypothetical protein